MIDFSNIEYLKYGNQKQLKSYELLISKNILTILYEFNPILVGTIPINIDIDSSDLDIICYFKTKELFINYLILNFENENQFSIREIMVNNVDSIVSSFSLGNFEIEIFGQNIPTKEQLGYKHMIIEHQILESKDENFRLEIIRQKQNGLKTEPAFAKVLGFEGNPYEELLKYKI
jgi:hypothetical protein